MKEKRPLIAAHRGVCGGNIPCNTLESFDIALRQGADIIELDVSRAADGSLFVFHPGMERITLYSPRPIAKMTADEVRAMYLVNGDSTLTDRKVSYFDDALEHLKGRCIINVDKFFFWMEEIAAVIRRHNMQDQVIVKTYGEGDAIEKAAQIAPDLPYMVITRKDDFSERLAKLPIRYMGTEVLFEKDTNELASPEYVEKMHKLGLKVWANAIVYNYRTVLSGGHNDDISIVGREDEGWGWLADRGYDIIQTDWTLPMRLYLENEWMKK